MGERENCTNIGTLKQEKTGLQSYHTISYCQQYTIYEHVFKIATFA